MDIEEVRKRQGKVEAEIRGILQKFVEDTGTNVRGITIMRQSISGFARDNIVKAIMEVEL